MNTQSMSHYIRQSYITHQVENRKSRIIRPVNHQERVENELHMLGLSHLALSSMESHYLPRVIHENEHLKAVIFGYESRGFAMLIATNFRIIYLDRKPLFTKIDELKYDIISGATIERTIFGRRINLHSPIRDYGLITINKKCAFDFTNYIEARCLESRQGKELEGIAELTTV